MSTPRVSFVAAFPEDGQRIRDALALLDLVERANATDFGPVIVEQWKGQEWRVTLHDEQAQDCPVFDGAELREAVAAAMAAVEASGGEHSPCPTCRWPSPCGVCELDAADGPAASANGFTRRIADGWP